MGPWARTPHLRGSHLPLWRLCRVLPAQGVMFHVKPLGVGRLLRRVSILGFEGVRAWRWAGFIERTAGSPAPNARGHAMRDVP